VKVRAKNLLRYWRAFSPPSTGNARMMLVLPSNHSSFFAIVAL
jgi:hypothetical protein